MMLLVNCSNYGRRRSPSVVPPARLSPRSPIPEVLLIITDLAPTARCQSAVLPPPATHPAPHPGSPGPPLPAHKRKIDMICWISHRNSRHTLKGCINDAKCMKCLLMNRFHFPDASIIMLTGLIDLDLSVFHPCRHLPPLPMPSAPSLIWPSAPYATIAECPRLSGGDGRAGVEGDKFELGEANVHKHL